MAHTSFSALLDAAERSGSIGAAAIEREAEDTGASAEAIFERMSQTLDVMEEAVRQGLAETGTSRSGLSGGQAAALGSATPGVVGAQLHDALASALAVAEVNARMGRVVAAPTGGASGVLPAVLVSASRTLGAPREATVLALAAAAAVGGVIAARASLSGATGGCQAEIGSAAAMAAVAAVQLADGTPEQAGQAAAFALQGLLGLVCDPVGGLVEVPCVARNATGTAVALASAEMALAGLRFPIPLDEVIDAMAHVGHSIPPSLRETAMGGLADTPTGRRLTAETRDGAHLG